MLTILILTVTITLPGQGPSDPVPLVFPGMTLEGCRGAGMDLAAESDDTHKVSFVCIPYSSILDLQENGNLPSPPRDPLR